jgi:Ca2+-transporting ATPase
VVKPIHTIVKGRARYKVEGLYRSEALKKHLESKLSVNHGIKRFSINTLTGSILIFFNSEKTHSDIATIILKIVTEHQEKDGKQQKVFDLKTQEIEHKPAPSRRKLRRQILKAEQQVVEQWHVMDSASVMSLLGTRRESGLSLEAVKASLKKYGPNILPESVPRSSLSIFINQFKSLPVALLGLAAGISLFTGGLADAIVILGVVTINSFIGYVTESSSEKTIHSLKSLVRPYSIVFRDSAIQTVSAENIAIGDILLLNPGSYVAADARLIEATFLYIDESSLTGESMPVLKTVPPIHRIALPIADRTNMVYMGTLVTGGQGLAVVVSTGKFTEIGKIQTLLGGAKPPDTPLEKKLDQISRQLVLMSGVICGIVFVIGILRGYGFLQMLKTSISLAVAAVPEGLPTVATTTLALGIRNMRRHNVLIRRLEAVETLGSVQTICLDKTGTLTMNRMTVKEIYTGSKLMTVSDGKFILEAEYISPYSCDELLILLHISVLCNESEVIKQNGEYIVNGTPTENALIHLAINAGVDLLNIKRKFPRVKIFHRSEKRNIMVTIQRTSNNNHEIFAIKGSPREVLNVCSWQIKNGLKLPLTEEDVLNIELANEDMAGKSLRVLGIAYWYGKNHDNASYDDILVSKDFVWVGIAGITDPTRKGVKELVEAFHIAGIATVMITGDQSPTAYAIAKELNLSRGEQLEILDSRQLADIPPDILKALCERVHVFARVSPSHKLQIVQALQQAGKVVGMTGDGINDGPALRAADIGIAMGHAGTDVAREVADVILEDDNLETMIIAVSQGRTIYNNIRKTVHFLLSTNMSEIMVMFAAITAGLGQPLNAMQLLWINLISDIFPGLALAVEPPEPDVLSYPPRNPDEAIIKSSDFKKIPFESALISAGALGAYGYGVVRYGVGPRAGTLAFMSLASGQLLHAVSCRSEKFSIFDKNKLPPNKYLNIALGGTFFLQALAMTIPGIRSLLGITPIGVLDGIIAGASALLPFVVNETSKNYRNSSGELGVCPIEKKSFLMMKTGTSPELIGKSLSQS